MGAIAVVLAGAVPPAAGAQQQPVTAATSLVIDGVTVVDVEQGNLVPDQRVVIVGNRIQAMGSGRSVKAPSDAQVVDARGKYLIPGLWDMHIHFAMAKNISFTSYRECLIHGVTGVREAGIRPAQVKGGLLDTLLQWRRDIAAGTRVGPRMLFASVLPWNSNPSRNVEPLSQENEEEIRDEVRRLKEIVIDAIKLLSLSRASFFVVAAEARRLGLPFGGHVEGKKRLAEGAPFAAYFVRNRAQYAAGAAEARRQGLPFQGSYWKGTHRYDEVPPMEASDSGASIIDHIHTEEITRRCLAPEATLEQCRPMAERFRRNGTWVVPTLLPHLNYVYTAIPQDDVPDSLRLLRVAHLAGLPIMAGTDQDCPSLHKELATSVAEGLTPLAALQTATLNPAKYLRGTDSLGTVAVGKLADLVLLDADPLADITNTRKIYAVVANGRYVDRGAFEQWLAEVRANAQQQP